MAKKKPTPKPEPLPPEEDAPAEDNGIPPEGDELFAFYQEHEQAGKKFVDDNADFIDFGGEGGEAEE